jgi:transcriptional regulator with XRE-family HTH domain
MRPLDPDRVIRGLGRRLAELRVSAGRTQESLAERARIPVKYLQLVESGSQNLSVRTLVRFANALGVPMADLFAPPTSLRRTRPGRPAGRRTSR